MRIVCVVGARPNFMKVKPVMDALERRGAEVLLVHTGQHYDPAMNDVFFADLGIRRPDRSLGVGSGSHAEQTARVMTGFEPLLAEVAPDAVVVVGDINSTVACALVTAKAGPLLAHVEAGLRSRDWRMPEEVNRVVTDRLSDYLLAPSQDAVENLRTEGYREDQIHLVGNVMIDSLLANLPRARDNGVLERLDLRQGEYGLVTLHRPANVDDPAVLAGMLKALGEVAQQCPLLLPAHPRAAGKLTALGVPEGVRLVPPAGYLDFLALQASARIVLTDSGGIQEETTALGVPCVTLRENTERPITVSEGTNVLAGIEPEGIVRTTLAVLAAPPPARRPALWDGRAGERIAEVLLTGGPAGGRARPTDLVAADPGPADSQNQPAQSPLV
ncbi:UDP-N-acetylglucosamine 2-epimerase (non-hydrolyzing) [Streptacidiphilus sp. MAP12-33]|uniref:non-hydrolyzing UDP-N-acetylglucosamine 2-epimerase n=1 Tax=Streptacidiphilus sp. MAP12-33 TaxID=3156266 RepID=UPI00351459C7